MGHRGCRLAVSYPEIAEMQTTAVIEAALNVREAGIEVAPEIMIPVSYTHLFYHFDPSFRFEAALGLMSGAVTC